MEDASLITESGIHDIPSAIYHSQCCDAPSVSSTPLRTLRAKSPAHMWATSDLNPAAIVEEVKKDLSFGRATHSLLLEGCLPEDEYAIEPFELGYNRSEEGWKAGEKRDWKEQQIVEGLTIVSQDDLHTIGAMKDALEAHPLIANGLFRGEIERSLFWKDPETGVYLKVRPDVLPMDGMLADYKGVRDASPQRVARHVLEYGYHIQLAMIAFVVKQLGLPEITSAMIVAQEKTPPYTVATYPLSDQFMDAGHFEFRQAYETFCKCLKDNHWPGYDDSDLHLPGWHLSKLEKEGMLPPEERG